MKFVRFLAKPVLVSLAIISLVISCRKDEGTTNDYLVSKDFIITYQESFINSLIEAGSSSYPEIADLKPLVSGDVDIYKIVYKTRIGNESINASGLLCVPSVQGDYPLLSFQNGTNTQNSNAPSEYVIYPPYQLVEIIASMGYIVVIPDYPGFGESADIAHPYLIAEPTVRSVVDMLYAVKEIGPGELPGITITDDLYIIGYSQGGWATLAVQKAIEKDYAGDFNLKGSVCGAGPYNLSLLFHGMTSVTTYPMPVYIGYIINAYSEYHQFTNPVSDILQEPYATRLPGLYNGTLTFDQINNQLTTSIPGLFKADFISGYESLPKFSSVRDALALNSVAGWNTSVPLLLIHGGGDTSVNPVSTENIYSEMIQAGTSASICKKEILPGLDHGDAVVPAMIRGLLFLEDLR